MHQRRRRVLQQQCPARLGETTSHPTGEHNTARTQGAGETVIGHISRLTRSILADCDPRFWPWAIKHAAFIWNHSSRQDENDPPPVVRAGLFPLKEAQRILKKYTKIEFGADVFVLRSQRAKKHRFNIRSVREEGKYLGLNIRQRGMVVRIGNRNYIRNNVVPKPKSSETEEEDQEPLDEDDNDDSENDDDYYEEDDDEDEDDDDKDADDEDDEDDDDDDHDHDDDDDDDDDNVDNVGNFDDNVLENDVD